MQSKQVQNNSKTAYPWSAPVMTYLGLVGSKTPPLKYSWVPLLLRLLSLASNVGSIGQESPSNHVPRFTEILILPMCDWPIRLIEDVLEYGFPSGYKILVQRPCLLQPKGEMGWGWRGECGGERSFPQERPINWAKTLRPGSPPSRTREESRTLLYTCTSTHTHTLWS